MWCGLQGPSIQNMESDAVVGEASLVCLPCRRRFPDHLMNMGFGQIQKVGLACTGTNPLEVLPKADRVEHLAYEGSESEFGELLSDHRPVSVELTPITH